MLTTTVAGRTWDFSHAIGRNAQAGNGFILPVAVALAPEGILYVLSRGRERIGDAVAEDKRIGKWTIDDEFVGDFGKNEFTWPVSLAVDKEGNVYCSDEYENVIAVYDADGQRAGEWGEAGSAEGQLSGPSGICFDVDDNLYVVDSMNDRVQKFTRDGRFMMTWGGPGSDDGQFNRPWGITTDHNGDVYVADWQNNCIQKFGPDGTFLMSFGSRDGEGGDLDHPADVAVDSEGDVYVTDWGNKRVQIYDPEGDIITALWGDDTQFSKSARAVVESNPDTAKAFRRVKDLTPLGWFNRPVGITVDEQDRVIVTDSNRARLQVYAKEKDYLEPQFNL
jgi:DNA-binding beta-propeller fold protein YncE